ncbi:MAG: HD domain-containing protein [Bacteroidetes bacterium]|nr:HD domain-containing protein [Bacteroidota bacterium]
MTQQEQIERTIEFVKAELSNAEGGHDWWHIHRVWKNACTIAKTEPADIFIVELGSLLHDIADHKFNGGNDNIGIEKAGNFLMSIDVTHDVIRHVQEVIANISFKGGNSKTTFFSPELAVIQDADRLDAIGAIGIARAFNYGGFKGRQMYHPGIKPVMNMSVEEYKNSTAPTINHFYEKLLLLKDRMNTESGRKLAEARHNFMLQYLDHFFVEWEGK